MRPDGKGYQAGDSCFASPYLHPFPSAPLEDGRGGTGSCSAGGGDAGPSSPSLSDGRIKQQRDTPATSCLGDGSSRRRRHGGMFSGPPPPPFFLGRSGVAASAARMPMPCMPPLRDVTKASMHPPNKAKQPIRLPLWHAAATAGLSQQTASSSAGGSMHQHGCSFSPWRTAFKGNWVAAASAMHCSVVPWTSCGPQGQVLRPHLASRAADLPVGALGILIIMLTLRIRSFRKRK